MNYKRLTDKKLRDTDIYPVLDEHGNVIVDRRLFNMFIEKHNRLAEIEDKIEQGTLIELPCKVGDTIYDVNNLDKKVIEFVVESIEVSITEYTSEVQPIIHFKEKKTGISRFYYFLSSTAIGETVFLTREEAEKKLKELQDEKF